MKRFKLALFEETDDEKKAREDRERREREGRRRGDDGRFLAYDDLEKANSKIHELNQENASRRTENKALKDAVDGMTKALESLKADSDRSRERTRRAEARSALVDAKISDPDLVDMFLKAAGDKVKFDDAGEVVGLKESLADFKKAKPHFFPAEPVLDEKGQPVLENGKPKMTAGYALPSENGAKDGQQDGKRNSTARGPSMQSATGGEGEKKIDLMERDAQGNFVHKNPDAVLDGIARQLRQGVV